MITEKDLNEAIAECQGTRNPNANTCMKLAAFYTILDHIQPQEEVLPMSSYSYAPPTQRTTVQYTSESDFAQMIQDKNYDDVLAVMDELMTTLSILNPSLYNGVLRKLSE